jgi:hypothetical protein
VGAHAYPPRESTALLLIVRLLVAAALLPVPIGVGAGYLPAPAAHGSCVPAPLAAGRRVHLELFANRRAIVVPSGIGLRDARVRFGRVTGASCRARLWTLEPTGVVRFARTSELGDLFRVWDKPLAPARLLSFRGRVRLSRNGVQISGDPRRLVLHDRDQLVLEVGSYVPPHRSYRFPRWPPHV